MALGKDPYLTLRIARALRDANAVRRGPNAVAKRIVSPANLLAGSQGAKSGRGRTDVLTDHIAIFSPVATLGKLFRR